MAKLAGYLRVSPVSETESLPSADTLLSYPGQIQNGSARRSDRVVNTTS